MIHTLIRNDGQMNARPVPLSLLWLLVLHRLPGAIATLLFLLLAAPIEAAGYPPLAAFLIAIAVGIVPFEFGVLALAGRRAESPAGLLAAIPNRRPMRLRDWLILVPGLLAIGIIGFGVLALVEPLIRDLLFGWLPDWFHHIRGPAGGTL